MVISCLHGFWFNSAILRENQANYKKRWYGTLVHDKKVEKNSNTQLHDIFLVFFFNIPTTPTAAFQVSVT